MKLKDIVKVAFVASLTSTVTVLCVAALFDGLRLFFGG